MSKKTKKKPVWKGQKRNAVGLPLTFTKYILYDNKLVIRKGFLNITEDEVELYKVKDKQLKISLLGRIFIMAQSVYMPAACIIVTTCLKMSTRCVW